MNIFISIIEQYVDTSKQDQIQAYMNVDVVRMIETQSTKLINNLDSLPDFVGPKFSAAQTLPMRNVQMQLLDAIVKKLYEKKLKNPQNDALIATLTAVERRVYPLVMSAVSRDRDCSPLVAILTKMVTEWMDCKVFRTHMMRNVLKYLEDYAPPPKPAASSPAVAVLNTEQRKQSVKLIEQERSRQKKTRNENALRSEEEAQKGWDVSQRAQFDEMWAHVSSSSNNNRNNKNGGGDSKKRGRSSNSGAPQGKISFAKFWASQDVKMFQPESKQPAQPAATTQTTSTGASSSQEVKTPVTPSATVKNTSSRVLIWDLDTVLLPIALLKDSKFCRKHKKNAQKMAELERTFEKAFISHIVKNHMFFTQLRQVPASSDAVSIKHFLERYPTSLEGYNFDDGYNCQATDENAQIKLTHRYAKIRELYETCSGPLLQFLLGKEQVYVDYQHNLKEMNEHLSGRLACTLDMLHHIQQQENVHVMAISSEPLIRTFATVMLCGISQYLPFHRVFSCNLLDRETVIQKMKLGFPSIEDVTFVGEQDEDETLAILSKQENSDRAVCDRNHIKFQGINTTQDFIDFVRRYTATTAIDE